MALLESLKLPLGSSLIDFSLEGIDDLTHQSDEYKEAKILVIIFTCNHCPYAVAVWPRLMALREKYKNSGVQLVSINPNFHPDYPEDDFDHMKSYAAKIGLNFPYLADCDQTVAKNYQAQCTPDIYVFDSERNLAYHGRIDDNWKEPAKVTKQELAEAIEALLHGEKPAAEQRPSMGCSIKWQN